MNFDAQPTLRGPLLELRPLRKADFEALFLAAADPAIWDQHFDPTRGERAGFEKFFEGALRSGGALVIIDRATGEVIGTSRYDTSRTEGKELEIGYTFLKRSHWGGRYNSELKALMLDHAFRHFSDVFFYVYEKNFRSQRAVEKLGAVKVELLDTPHHRSFKYRLGRATSPPPREVYSGRPEGHTFTYAYAQPKEYHFCLDSIIFPYFVSRQLPERHESPKDFRVLDLCAGCGVIGLELAYYRPWIENFDFLELQPIFRPYFEKNLETAQKRDRNYRFLEADLRTLQAPEARARYDLIVANPPYFHPDEGNLPPGDVKRRARFFGDASMADLLRSIENALKPRGRAYLLVRPGEAHGRDAEDEIARLLSPGFRSRIAADIRRTWAVEIRASE